MRILLLLVLLTPAVLAQTPCTYCGASADLQTIEYRDQPRQVCVMCRKKLPRCQVCGNPSNQKAYRDGRDICQGCLATGVFDQARLDTVYQQVQKFINSYLGGIAIKPPPPAQLADKDELQTKFIEGGRAMDVGGFYQPYNPEKIYILSGDTDVETAATLVHEYTHAWQSRNCPSQDRALTEGFASWVEYKYLVSRGETYKAQALTRKPDPDYGAALVKFLELEKKLKPEGVIRYVQENAQFR